MAVDFIWFADRIGYTLGEDGRFTGFFEIHLNHGKFIASNAGNCIAVPDALRQSLTNRPQQNVAHRLPHRIVDRLETVRSRIKTARNIPGVNLANACSRRSWNSVRFGRLVSGS